jgi:hypothetical protein
LRGEDAVALGLALALVVFVLVATVGVLGWDFGSRPPGQRLSSVREWQTLIGAVLGFLGAAGVLVFSATLERDQEAYRSDREARAIGLGLAIEAERLTLDLQGGRYMITNMTFEGADGSRQCAILFEELARLLDSETPVYDAVLPRMVDFGDDNLQSFVRFYGVYRDINSLVRNHRPDDCSEALAKNTATQLSSLINGGIMFYDVIAQRYATVPTISPDQLDQSMQEDAEAAAAAPETGNT